MNAGAALYAGVKAASIADGTRLANELIDSGAALKKLQQLIEETQKLSA